MNSLPRQTHRLRSIALASALLASAFASPSLAQDKDAKAPDPEGFGDIFVHPRDRNYLPGQAPSRARLEETKVYEDGRGVVNRYEYDKNGTVISRETWTDERGESRGRFGVGVRF